MSGDIVMFRWTHGWPPLLCTIIDNSAALALFRTSPLHTLSLSLARKSLDIAQQGDFLEYAHCLMCVWRIIPTAVVVLASSILFFEDPRS